MTPLTAATVRRTFLDPALEATARNLEQAGLLVNDTPECDSVIEHLVALHRAYDHEHVRGLASLARRLALSNHAERGHERLITGAADALVIDLRDLELNGNGHHALTAKSVARTLRGPLSVLQGPAKGLAYVDAVRAVDRVLSSSPAAQVFAPAVRHELGVDKYRLLKELHARRSHQAEAVA